VEQIGAVVCLGTFFEKQLGACGGLGFFVFALFAKNACGGPFFLVCKLRLTKSGVYGGLF
jgi:hypothetical protein